MPGLKPILLVEDSPLDIELTLAALARSRLANEVIVARDGVEALDHLERGCKSGLCPAVVLLDIKLPRIDGLEVLAKVKGNPATRHIPIVMLTSSSEEQDILKSYKLGVNAFVVKPVGFDEFFKAIRDLGVFWAIINEPPPLGREAGGGDGR